MGALVAGRPIAVRRRAGAAAAAFLLAGLAVWMLATRPPAVTAEERAAERAAFVAVTAVRPVRVALTGGGGLLDLRYQVVDADKAAAAHDPKRSPALLAEGSGRRFDQPWMGHSHSGDFRAGGVYFSLLVNPGGRLEAGSEVTLEMAGARYPGLRVQ
jgi:hypothetical protein